jgi:hypothetical protein
MSEVRWEAESLRATAFYPAAETPSDVSRLWELLMHRRPDQLSSRPNEGIHVAEGSFGGSEKQLQCTIRPERVDWVLRAVPPAPNRQLEGLPTVGTFAGVLPSFQELGTRWLERSSAITRVAFGAALLFEVSNLDEANERLSALLPSLTMDPEGVSDLLFRINRRRSLASRGGSLANRISTWSIVQGGSVGFAVPGDGPPQFTYQTGHFACKLDLDINTVGTLTTPLGGVEAAEVFRELVVFGSEIAKPEDKP